MSQAKVIFTFDCQNITIQCSQEDKMSDICKKIASKLEYNMNSLLFLYNGNHINFCLKFKEQINTIDKNYITPWLRDHSFPAMAESGWLTRSLEQPVPYDLNYTGKIMNVKNEFLTTFIF